MSRPRRTLAEKQAALRAKLDRERERAQRAEAWRAETEQNKREFGAFKKMEHYLRRQAREMDQERRVTAFCGCRTTAMLLDEAAHYETVAAPDLRPRPAKFTPR